MLPSPLSLWAALSTLPLCSVRRPSGNYFRPLTMDFSLLFLLILFLFLAVLRGFQDLSPQPGIEPKALAVKVLSLNHWTAREFPVSFF